MNKIVLIGNLTKDAELRYAQGTGNAVAKFTLAVPRGYKKDETDFINCVVFSKMAENVAQYTQKGSKVAVEGELRVNSYTANDGTKRYVTEVFCNNVEFLTRAQNGANVSNNNNYGAGNNGGANVSNNDPFGAGLNDDLGVFMEPIDEGDSPF